MRASAAIASATQLESGGVKEWWSSSAGYSNISLLLLLHHSTTQPLHLFFKPPPPAGVGMRCSALDLYSYAEVKATSRKLTIAPKDSAGRLVREPTGKRCGPFTVKRR